MKTADLPVGIHVAYDRSSSRSYPSYVEAFVVAHRPRGNKSSYWGNNGNHNTVGVAFSSWYTQSKGQLQTWDYAWVRPQDIGMTWDEFTEAQDSQKKRDAQWEKDKKDARADRTRRFAAIHPDVKGVLGLTDWYGENLVKDGSVNVRFTMDKLEAVIQAVLLAQPENKAAKVQAEVEAALALL